MHPQEISVLLVDDSALVQTMCARFLRSAQITDIACAEDGIQALAMYRDRPRTVVFLDITMPHQDGIETLRQLLEFDPQAKIVMLTAVDDESHQREDAMRLGASEYIRKPVIKPEPLLRALSTIFPSLTFPSSG